MPFAFVPSLLRLCRAPAPRLAQPAASGETPPASRPARAARAAVLAALLPLVLASTAAAEDVPEYRLKAAFLYNFAAFVDWQSGTGTTLTVCVLSPDPFGAELDALNGKSVGGRRLVVQRRNGLDALDECNMVFVPAPSIGLLPRAEAALRGHSVLLVADTPGAVNQGAHINMVVIDSKVRFDVNLKAARAAPLGLSSKLLRLARDVVQ